MSSPKIYSTEKQSELVYENIVRDYPSAQTSSVMQVFKYILFLFVFDVFSLVLFCFVYKYTYIVLLLFVNTNDIIF